MLVKSLLARGVKWMMHAAEKLKERTEPVTQMSLVFVFSDLNIYMSQGEEKKKQKLKTSDQWVPDCHLLSQLRM